MTTDMTVLVEFELVDPVQRTWKVLGAINMESQTLELVAPPAYFTKDEIVTLAPFCKYPLDDYRDTRYYNQQSYVFIKANGTQEEGILDGFTYTATYAGAGTCNGKPSVTVAMRKVDAVPLGQAQSNATHREGDDSEGSA